MNQPLTPELAQWLVAQRHAGHNDEAILRAMLQSGWTESSARVALSRTLVLLKDPVPAVPAAAAAGAYTPGLPEPKIDSGATSVWAGDREVQILTVMASPRVIVFGNLLSAEECAGLREAAAPRLSRSETVKVDTGGSEVNESRTSQGMFFMRGENDVCKRFEARVAALLNWPLDHGEGLQILRYGPGAEYRPHYDYFDPNHSGTQAILKRGGQRVGTLVTYLNTPTCGGATTFPDVGLEVQAIQGNAVFFSYDRPEPSTRTLHGGAPVLKGEKWVATKWLRQGHFE
ncbi:MAG: 2OG-Fe(II) oxygenase [Pseudomonadota bacterium]